MHRRSAQHGPPRAARLVAVVSLLLGVLALVLALRADDPYEVTALFPNAGQVVKGAEVQVAGRRIGTVRSVELGRGFRAALRLRIDDRDLVPLRRGTKAVIRQVSLSGIANRFIDLQLPPSDGRPALADGAVLTEQDTSPVVDVDQVFNTLRPRERAGLRRLVRGFGDQIDGRSAQARAGFAYLDPSLAASGRLFGELTRDRAALERLVVDSSKLATDVAARREDLAGLVDRLATFVQTLAGRRAELDEALRLLPTFLRRADTTFVNLRATLDDLEPTLLDARPVARRLGPVLAQLRPFAREAVPTVRDLARALQGPKGDDDLVDLTRSSVALRDQLVRPAERNGKRRRGTLPELADALRGQINGFAALRPYTPELLSWFDDFAHTGLYDANGGASRTSLSTNAFTSVNGVLTPVPAALRNELFDQVAAIRQDNRCPGAADHRADDRSNAGKPTPSFDCDPDQQLPGD